MIEVRDLSKTFSGVRALRGVSFNVEEGEILGFLGPNGAGKSTLMRILTGFLPGDSGAVRVAGHDVSTNSLAVRQALGYLPEGVPLYPEMRVTEYLRYRGRLKGVSRRPLREMIDRALERTALTDVRHRIIGTLSRGYRQRVGLADALLAEPPVLVLDEPTVGLDPEQVRQFRQLLGEVGRERTVILSTHILTEVELVCSNVVIIHKGQVVARDRAENLRRRFGHHRRVVAEIVGNEKDIRAALIADERIRSVTLAEKVVGPDSSSESYRRYLLEVGDDDDVRPWVFEVVRDRGWRLRELRIEEVSLEDAFVGIVGERTE